MSLWGVDQGQTVGKKAGAETHIRRVGAHTGTAAQKEDVRRITIPKGLGEIKIRKDCQGKRTETL